MTSYLVVGSGLFGAVFAEQMANGGDKVTVIEKRNHIAGNIYTEEMEGIQVHKYGAHIFHTSNKRVWDYINQFATFNRFTNTPLAKSRGSLYNLPFNMNTFYALWGVETPEAAKEIIADQTKGFKNKKPRNLEEQALSLVGKDIYEKLIKEYTEKQWGRSCKELPAFIIRRLPLRFTFDNNYFNDIYQGIPIGGYTQIVEKMLDHPNITVQLQTDFMIKKQEWLNKYDRIIYTGMIDEFYNYCFGELEYRSLTFVHEHFPIDSFQGNAVVNYIDKKCPYTRIIEHKHFEFGTQPNTVITKEYPKQWLRSEEPYYPINNDTNQQLYQKYLTLALKNSQVIFGGRLGMYQYFDMHQVIEEALNLAQRELLN
ncbi:MULTISPECIES: UDP-galactopyranose mutase [Enterococcus]|uniref:UDP-galactopyranose mutase n=1 Tax=Enterococcus TaxID=1350 RepID=UPI0007F4A927|nr:MULTISPECIES: UDP-galactopyranose mutase [Enterococcus]SAM79613.1 UDP-galactopyranose mutase [Enterococcus faecium]MDT2570094.1 UDP-galactopyranose mutase [Enterococcus raffinosus]OFT87622.1 UDP-galactopyranose mutase [Enterococcus sp. HMSC29A04]OFU59040.1 UDP-galactopyranose mutase [Enterococcus sp. HMSC14A10]QXJ61593.1 UDP-galactopyranose mutase [Enterococcus raffinosus]